MIDDLNKYPFDILKSTLTESLAYASLGGHLYIVQYLIELGSKYRLGKSPSYHAIDIDVGIKSAIVCGDIKILEYLFGKGDKDKLPKSYTIHINHNNELVQASECGHLHIVEYLVRIGATEFTASLTAAAENGHIDIVKYFINKSVKSLDRALYLSCKNGHTDVFIYLISQGAKCTSLIKRIAINKGSDSIISFINSL